MKRRRTLITSLLLVAALALGIGYAALTDVLDINGTAKVEESAAEDAFNADVYFSAAVANQAGNAASVDADDNDKACVMLCTCFLIDHSQPFRKQFSHPIRKRLEF